MSTDPTPTEDAPSYAKQREHGTTNLWIITVDEGWRQSILCSGMYEWQADWLLSLLERQPYAKGFRP